MKLKKNILQNKKYRVFELLKQVPAGKVVTYGSIAKLVGITNPRLVGQILHSNPDPRSIPCHRVVRSDGRIASGYAFGGQEAQIKILREEGIEIKKGKIVDMSRYKIDL